MSLNIIKKVAAFVLAGTMILSLAACESTKDSGTEDSSSAQAESTQDVKDNSLGGWEVNNGKLSLKENAEAKAAFEKATEGLTGYEYEPIALLGTQIVSGTNYSILARGKAVVPDAEPSYEIITIYEDLEGNTEVLGMDEVLFDTEDDVPSSENVQIPDPFEGFSTLEQAVKAAGFEMSVPDAPKWYETAIYRANTGTQMLEVIYSDKDLENEDAVEAYRIRKAIGSDDISGDYNDYSEKTEVSVSGNQVSLKGNDGKVFVATWTSGEFTYAIDIDMDGQGLSGDEIIALVNATK